MDPLSAIDAASLAREDGRTHMHVGGVVLLEGPAPPWRDVTAHVRERLHLVPRYRQRVVAPPARLGGPSWADDPAFRLEYHLRHGALPAPGDAERLSRLVARVMSQRLDRHRPLWELWCVEGLAGGRWALISKTHHALVDDAGGIDLLSVLFDHGPQGGPPLDVAPAWLARPTPSSAQLAAQALGSRVRSLSTLPLRAFGAPARARQVAASVGGGVRSRAQAAPDSLLNERKGPHRRVAFTSAPLEDLKAVKDTFGGTVNDVVLAGVAGGIRALYHRRRRPADSGDLRACVPVSTVVDADQGAPGNRIEPLLAPLPIGVADPVDRLRFISAALAGVREERGALAAGDLVELEDFAPPTILARAARVQLDARLYNVAVTNVPGPQSPLWMLGRRLEQALPVPFLPAHRALSVAALSYDGEMTFAFLGDLDVLPDVGVVAEGARAAIDQLARLTR